MLFFLVSLGFIYHHFKTYDKEKRYKIYETAIHDDKIAFNVTKSSLMIALKFENNNL